MPKENIKVIYFMESEGLANYTVMLANAVSNLINVVIIGQNGAGHGHLDSNIDIKEVLKCPVGWDIRNLLSFKNMVIADTIRPDIIHVTTDYPVINAIVNYCLAKKYPLVVTVHDPRPHPGEIKYTWRSIFVDFFHMILVKKADKIIVHSEKHKKEIIERRISSEKIIVLPHGDYSLFTKFKNNDLSEKNCILFFGRIVKYKGLEYLIKAVPLISKKIPDIKIIIAGRGNFSEYRKLIMDENLNNYFEIFNEYIPDDKVADLFVRAQAIVLPYTEVTQSGPLHIAYAFKKPVIATDIGAFTEVVESGKTGILVPPGDINALAEAIIELLEDDTKRNEMGGNAYRKMKQEMSWDNIAEKTIEVYKQAIDMHMKSICQKVK